ncbi:PD-(D/E)XK nuclease family protein [Amycolatopsis samaneae]|uniref:PD-(D/E)XK nuclease family protein n=1 Tax=Amycolatopsis samaneae TaxID=664691 RepID=A0ABW5GX64_9PSEU
MSLAAKIRQWSPDARRFDLPLESFTLGPLMIALDRLEFGGASPEEVIVELARRDYGLAGGRKPVHPALAEWTIGALRNYLAARSDADTPAVVPVPFTWVVRKELEASDSRSVDLYEWTSWGRRYRSADGRIREMWLMSFDEPKPKSAAELAAAAHVAAHGDPVEGLRRGTSWLAQPRPADRVHPQEVRLAAFGAGSARAEPLGRWSRAATPELFGTDVLRVAVDIIDGRRRVPGGSCADCKVIDRCPSAPSHDLLPNVRMAVRGRRSISATDLRNYAACPARYHLYREVGLPRSARPESPPIVLGRAVDSWLNDRHRLARARCEPDDVQPLEFPGIPTDMAEAATRMVRQHTGLCPVTADPEARPRVQELVSAYDSRLDVILLATPDLLYRRHGGWMWRETKTAAKPLWRGQSLLRRIPQLAVGVVLLAASAAGEITKHSRVELEHLRVDDRAFEEFDPNMPKVLAEARDVVGEMLAPLLRDTRYEPATGDGCLDCPVRRWCADGTDYVSARGGQDALGEADRVVE